MASANFFVCRHCIEGIAMITGLPFFHIMIMVVNPYIWLCRINGDFNQIQVFERKTALLVLVSFIEFNVMY